jgi:hypothetical protein
MRHFFYMYLVLASASMSAAGATLGVCPPMPGAMNDISRDIKSDISGSVGRLGKINVGAVGVKTEVTASTLFGKYPNVDRLITLQTMSSTYCNMLNQSGLPPLELLSRWEVFQNKVLSLESEAKEVASHGDRVTVSSVQKSVTDAQPQVKSPLSTPRQTAVVTILPADRFKKTQCGSIKDLRTGLEWYVGNNENLTWGQSKTWTESLNKCGGNWRMPKTAELRGLFDPASSAGQGYYIGGKYWPARLSAVFSKIGGGSWVWSDKELGDGKATAFNFNQGVAVNYEKENQEYSTRAFAVR